MQTLDLKLPDAATVKGELYAELHPDVLTQDVLEIELPNGVFIDVGWYPEHDLGGKFLVRMFRDSWENQLGAPIKSDDPTQVKEIVELLAASAEFT